MSFTGEAGKKGPLRIVQFTGKYRFSHPNLLGTDSPKNTVYNLIGSLDLKFDDSDEFNFWLVLVYCYKHRFISLLPL